MIWLISSGVQRKKYSVRDKKAAIRAGETGMA
jgi:hypothetical protein